MKFKKLLQKKLQISILTGLFLKKKKKMINFQF